MVKLILGQVVATPAAISLLEEHGVSPLALLTRHEHGDWGNLDPEDRRANDNAVAFDKTPQRVLSCYQIARPLDSRPFTEMPRVWIITEWDRSVTTILLPSEY